jgi:hypothetical protein
MGPAGQAQTVSGGRGVLIVVCAGNGPGRSQCVPPHRPRDRRLCEEKTIMPEWRPKDERQYEHIKESARSRGRSEKRAKELAARTVNKQRQQEGRTPNRTPQGTGNPMHPLEDRSKEELYNRAKELDISGRSGMTKPALIKAIRERT